VRAHANGERVLCRAFIHPLVFEFAIHRLFGMSLSRVQVKGAREARSEASLDATRATRELNSAFPDFLSHDR